VTQPSENPSLYKTDQNSYKRYSAREQGFRRTYTLKLLKAFDCTCANCGADDNGMELDHFFVPKCSGGDFVLVEAAGTKRLNAVPLCMTCNREKNQRPASAWLSLEKIDAIWAKARHLDAEISGVPVVATNAEPPKPAEIRPDYSGMAREEIKAKMMAVARAKYEAKREEEQEREKREIEAEKARLAEMLRNRKITEKACKELGVPVPKFGSKASGHL
jgi:hypothetical protein